jgi:hypothetical protein
VSSDQVGAVPLRAILVKTGAARKIGARKRRQDERDRSARRLVERVACHDEA